MEFNYGSRSYERELKHIYKIAYNAQREKKLAQIKRDRYLIEKSFNKSRRISEIMYNARKKRNNYHDNTTESIRKEYYNKGVDVVYSSRNKKGEIIKQETIHYKMLYRSTGKAKKGSCMFIRDSLYDKAIHFLRMGIELPNDNSPVVEISAYSPLTSSSIVGKVKINPKNILILKDISKSFITNVISVETDEHKHCTARKVDNYELSNILFDGQSLIDSSKFPSWGNGYILLRHHFFKSAAFCSNIQQFFRDYFGSAYDKATVKDMFGNEHYVKDIELITTDNSIKWLKFDVSYDYWCKWVNDNECMFGIVKTAHESKLGDVQKMSYQMVNSLNVSTMRNIVKSSVEYINRLKQDNAFFLEYLDRNSNFSNDYEVLAALCRHNVNFFQSEYFRKRKKKIIEAYVLNFKSGKIIQNAENLTIVGSPYAMLLYAANGDEQSVDMDDTFYVENEAIQCYTSRFEDGEYLAEFRSPFNGRNNMGYLHNVFNDKFDKYFNFGKQIIAVNMIGTDFQDKNNGSDMDSDSIYTTNHPDIVAHAKYCCQNYPTIVNNIPKEQNSYKNTMDCFSEIDNNLAKSQLAIGESSNLAQLALTYSYNFDDDKYNYYVCILSVLAQVAIDNAKRRFDIDLDEEISRIKSDLNIKENRYPSFWKIIKKEFSSTNINPNLICPMNYLYDMELNKFRSNMPTLPMSHFCITHPNDASTYLSKKIKKLIYDYSLSVYRNMQNNNNDFLLNRSDFDELIFNISSIKISEKYIGLMSWLINHSFQESNHLNDRMKEKKMRNKNQSILLKTLYSLNSDCFLSCFVMDQA